MTTIEKNAMRQLKERNDELLERAEYWEQQHNMLAGRIREYFQLRDDAREAAQYLQLTVQ